MNNKNGFSLIEIVIAMGLASALLLFYMKMQAQQVKSQKSVNANLEIDSFTNDIKGAITKSGFCDKSFENVSLPDNSTANIQAISDSLGKPRYMVGESYGNNAIKLKSLRIKDFKPDDTQGRQGEASLEIAIEKKGNVYGSKNIIRIIQLNIQRDNDDRIVACGPLASSGLVPTIETLKASDSLKKVDLNSKQIQDIIKSNTQLKELKETTDALKKMQEEMNKDL